MRILFLLIFLLTAYKTEAGDSLSKKEVSRVLSQDRIQYYESNLDVLSGKIRIDVMYRLALHYFTADPLKSIKYAKQLIAELEKMEVKPVTTNEVLCLTYMMLGRIYNINYNNGFEAISHLIKAKEIAGTLNDDLLYRQIEELMGMVYLVNNEFYKGLGHIERSVGYAQSLNDSISLVRLYLQFVSVYTKLSKNDSALYYLSKAEEIVDPSDSLMMFNIGNTKVELLVNAAEYAIAKKLALALLSSKTVSSKRFNIENYIHDLYLKLAYIAAVEKKPLDAKKHLDVAYQYFTSTSRNIDYKLKCYSYSALINEKCGDYDAAITAYKSIVKFKNEVINSKEKLILRSFETQYILYENEKEIEALILENQYKARIIKNNRIILVLSVLIVLICIMGIGFGLNYYREKEKTQKIIEKQREELIKKEHAEKMKLMELKAANAQIVGQEVERDRLAKELHDGIGGSIAGIKMEVESLKSTSSERKAMENVSNLIAKVYDEVRTISHNLATPVVAGDRFEDIYNNMTNRLLMNSSIETSISIYPTNINWNNIKKSVKKELYRISQEAFSNILKHANASYVEVQIIVENNKVSLSIEDNGKGFDVDSVKDGLGLRNMLSRVESVGGTMEIDSSPSQGTFFVFNIPNITD